MRINIILFPWLEVARMEVCLELFLLDNFLMDALVLNIAGTLCAKRQRTWGSALAALIGAVYAAVSLACGGIWAAWPVKVLVSLGMIALAFRFRKPREAFLCAACFYAATAVTGGMAFALLSLFGGVFEGGMLMLPDTLRPALLALVVASILPRVVKRFTAKRRLGTRAELRIHWPERTDTVTALIDTGHRLLEPISGAYVVVVSNTTMPPVPEGKGRAVVYATLGGEGVLWACKPMRIEWRSPDGWRDMPLAYAAAAPQPLQGGIGAIVSAEWIAMAFPAPKTDGWFTNNTQNAEG